MLFNSYEFIFLFLPIVFVGYFLLLSKRLIVASKAWLVAGSLFFYSYWNLLYLPLILLSIFVNYAIGIRLVRTSNSKATLIAGIAFNLALLGYFKYTNFFLTNFNTIFDSQLPLPAIALPLAISFFTFQQIAFLVDSYRGECKEYDLLSYMLFVTFFPQLIAGPIVHHQEIMPQFSNKQNFIRNYKNIATGILLFSIGLFKKTVIADGLAPIANIGFDEAPILNFFEAWATSLSYTLQLYFDFSGYTDMAIGAALLFNIKLPTNFNSPYKASNIQEFWRRWHITLSRFLKDYLYVPLGGNRVGRFRGYLNLLSVFILGGLWHGASWMFVIWGALHGIATIIHRIYNHLGFKMYGWLAWLITFNFINVAWIFFRAKELEDALKVLRGMLGFNGVILPGALSSRLEFLQALGIRFDLWMVHMRADYTIAAPILTALLLSLLGKNSTYFRNRFTPNKTTAFLVAFIFYYGLLNLLTVKSEFLYFNF